MNDRQVNNQKSKPQILFLLHLPPPVHGSSVVGKQIRDSQAIQKGVEGCFINLNTSPSVDKIGDVSVAKVGIFLAILGRLARRLIAGRPDLAYIAITVKGIAFYKDAVVVALVKLFRVPVVYHLHNKGVATRQDRFLDRWLYRFVFRKAQVILLSKHLYSDIARFVPEENVHYCPNGIPDEAVEPRGEKVKSDPPTILFLSNLIVEKGVLVLLEACRLLQERGIAFRCLFVGGEGDLSASQFAVEKEKHQLGANVDYLGKRYGEEKNAVFAEADIFCLPTFYHNETFGLVNLEAMQWSLPVVATPEGGIPDVVLDGQTGYLVPQRNAEALADSLEVLLSDPELRFRMGKAGRRHYEANFTQSHFEERMRVILSEVIAT